MYLKFPIFFLICTFSLAAEAQFLRGAYQCATVFNLAHPDEFSEGGNNRILGVSQLSNTGQFAYVVRPDNSVLKCPLHENDQSHSFDLLYNGRSVGHLSRSQNSGERHPVICQTTPVYPGVDQSNLSDNLGRQLSRYLGFMGAQEPRLSSLQYVSTFLFLIKAFSPCMNMAPDFLVQYFSDSLPSLEQTYQALGGTGQSRSFVDFSPLRSSRIVTPPSPDRVIRGPIDANP